MAKRLTYDILFQDDNILCVNKPSGMPVIPGRNLETLSLKQRLEKDLAQQIWVTHRIDKETSGIVLFAKTAEAHKLINMAFQDHKINKVYRCICRGSVKKDVQHVNKPIYIDSKTNKVKIHPHGKESRSSYKSIEISKSYSLVEVHIETGRMHQVRVHMSSEGYPIVGDQLYNNKPEIYLKDIKKKYKGDFYEDQRPMISRCALHAYGLSFVHPITGEKMKIHSELPKDIKACWNQLHKNDK